MFVKTVTRNSRDKLNCLYDSNRIYVTFSTQLINEVIKGSNRGFVPQKPTV